MTLRLNRLAGVLVSTAPLFALSCVSLDAPPTATDDAPANVGAIGLNLMLPSDMESADLDYKIVGAGAYQKVGSIPLGVQTGTFLATITGIPVGKGYQLQLDSGADSKLHCMASTEFDILTSQQATPVGVKLLCRLTKEREDDAGSGPAPVEDAGTGGVEHGDDHNLCPEIDGLYRWKEKDGTYELSSSACDMDSSPAPLSYHWIVSAGQLSAADEDIVRFTCPESGGDVHVTLEVSDSLCKVKYAAEIKCECADDAAP